MDFAWCWNFVEPPFPPSQNLKSAQTLSPRSIYYMKVEKVPHGRADSHYQKGPSKYAPHESIQHMPDACTFFQLLEFGKKGISSTTAGVGERGS